MRNTVVVFALAALVFALGCNGSDSGGKKDTGAADTGAVDTQTDTMPADTRSDTSIETDQPDTQVDTQVETGIDAQPEIPVEGAPGSTCNCDSDCLEVAGHAGLCVSGICMNLGSAPCSEAGSQAECPEGSRCWAIGEESTPVCWPDCEAYECAGECDSDDSCAPSEGMDCDRSCGTFCTGGECIPECDGRACGPDMCGGTCGEPCPSGNTCSPSGQCIEDGEGNLPGSECDCDEDCATIGGQPGICVFGICMNQAAEACSSGGSRHECPEGSRCWGLSGFEGSAICWPDCDAYECAGECDSDDSCVASETMGCDPTCATYCSDDPCEPECGDRVCGPDPVCGESCGECSMGSECNEDGQCSPVEFCVGDDCLDCAGLFRCVAGCGSDGGCTSACISEATEEACEMFEQIASCVEENCPDPEDLQCITEALGEDGACAQQLAHCMEGGAESCDPADHPDDPDYCYDCSGIFECLGGCTDEPCPNQCIARGTAEAQSLAWAYDDCVLDNCPDPEDLQCRINASSDGGACFDEYTACFGP